MAQQPKTPPKTPRKPTQGSTAAVASLIAGGAIATSGQVAAAGVTAGAVGAWAGIAEAAVDIARAPKRLNRLIRFLSGRGYPPKIVRVLVTWTALPEIPTSPTQSPSTPVGRREAPQRTGDALRSSDSPRRPTGSAGTAEQRARRGEAVYRAWYLQNATRRVVARQQRGMTLEEALQAERGTLMAHLRAQYRRRASARRADALTRGLEAAGRSGAHRDEQGRVWLEWRTHLDERTTMDCRIANGHVFRADTPPIIGFPGSVHPHCRCTAVPATLTGMVSGTVNDALRGYEAAGVLDPAELKRPA